MDKSNSYLAMVSTSENNKLCTSALLSTFIIKSNPFYSHNLHTFVFPVYIFANIHQKASDSSP